MADNKNQTIKKKKQQGKAQKPAGKADAQPQYRKKKNGKASQQEPKKSAHIRLEVQKDHEAQGVRKNIMVLPNVVPAAIEALPLAIIARGLLFQQNSVTSPIFWAYYAFMRDIIAIMSNQVSPVTQRLKYVSEIISSWVPKTVPFKTGTLSYAWEGVGAIAIPNSITVRGFRTFLWVPDSTVYGIYWLTQVAPSNPSTDTEAFDKLASVYTVIGKQQKGMLAFTALPGQSSYSKDSSAFVACSLYYGSGNIAGVGASMSVENEVPFKSRLLAGSNLLDTSEGRVARNFGLASGDTTAAFGFPFLPGFQEIFYNTAYPVQYKFIDLDEVVYTLEQYYLKLVGLASVGRSLTYNQQTDYSLLQFNYTPQQFRIAVRQVILSYFAASAPMTQFLNYSIDANGFEPFRCGTNTMPNNQYEMRMPTILVENLRMLLPAYGFVPTKFERNKNALMMIPVWGIYKSRQDLPYNVQGTLYEEINGTLEPVYNAPLFAAVNDDPNPIDGSGASGECVDLNSPIISQLIQEWNSRIEALSAWSSPTAFLAGTSPTTVLTITRYMEYKELQEIPLSRIPLFRQHLINPACIKVVKRASKDKLKDKLLQKTPYPDDKYYVPPQFSLFSQVNKGYASMQTITEQLRTLLQYFIFPSIAITPGQAPDQRAVRTHSLESNIWDFSESSQDAFSSRESELTNYAGIMASGIASGAKSDELIALVQQLNTSGKGGWLGDILTGVASVVLPMIPI